MMKQWFNNWIRPVMHHQFGFDIIRLGKTGSYVGYPPDFSIENIKKCEAVKHYTMTSPERVNSLINAVRYVVTRKVDGAFVECGVWKGGSSMAIAWGV
jgi:O-methyltransferase